MEYPRTPRSGIYLLLFFAGALGFGIYSLVTHREPVKPPEIERRSMTTDERAALVEALEFFEFGDRIVGSRAGPFGATKMDLPQRQFNFGYSVKCVGGSLHLYADALEMELAEFMDGELEAELRSAMETFVDGIRISANGAEEVALGLIRMSGLNDALPVRSPHKDRMRFDDEDADA